MQHTVVKLLESACDVLRKHVRNTTFLQWLDNRIDEVRLIIAGRSDGPACVPLYDGTVLESYDIIRSYKLQKF